MSEHILALIDQEIDRLSAQIGEIDSRRINLARERDKLVRLSGAPKAAKPKKAASRKSGGPSVKEQILAHMREIRGPVKMAEIVAAIGAKNTTINGTLHQLKKAGQVTNTADGWTIAMPASNHNGGAEAHA